MSPELLRPTGASPRRAGEVDVAKTKDALAVVGGRRTRGARGGLSQGYCYGKGQLEPRLLEFVFQGFFSFLLNLGRIGRLRQLPFTALYNRPKSHSSRCEPPLLRV